MVKRIGTVYPGSLNKGFSWTFCVDSRIRHETLKEGRRTYRPKPGDYNNKDEVNNLDILRNNYQFSSQKSRHIYIVIWSVKFLKSFRY